MNQQPAATEDDLFTALVRAGVHPTLAAALEAYQEAGDRVAAAATAAYRDAEGQLKGAALLHAMTLAWTLVTLVVLTLT